MQIRFNNRGTTLIVDVSGELDHHTAEYLKQKVDGEIIKSINKNVVFDFTNVTFMDSSGIGVIMGRYKNIQNFNGKMAIANASPQIKRIFEMSGLMRVIPTFENLEEAFKSF